MSHSYLKKNLSFWIPMKKKKFQFNKIKAKTKATFQILSRSTLFVGQVFSLIPVVGIFSNNATEVKLLKLYSALRLIVLVHRSMPFIYLFPYHEPESSRNIETFQENGPNTIESRFVLTSWKCVYAFLSLIGQFFIFVMTIIYVINSKATVSRTTEITLYGTTCITMIMFFQVAKSWPDLVQYIAHVEELDPSYDKTLKLKCNVTCAIIMILSLAEHIIGLFQPFGIIAICYPTKPIYEGFIRRFYPWVFNFVPYSPVLGLLTQATFTWNFSDLFVIYMSYYLTSRLNHVNKKLLAAQGKYLPEIFWRGRREDFGRATQLVKKFDGVISGIVFITFANNLFFICVRLFNTLEVGIEGTEECSNYDQGKTLLGGYEAAAFNSFSLVYLILRSIAVSLIASEVHSASLVPPSVLYYVPSPVYCVEVQRFLEQVNGDKVALTGFQFFSITRGLLLNVAGTIVTYELVMFQFNSPSSLNNSMTSFNLTTAAALPP